MQPTIICIAPTPGMIYLNGRFAGEAGPDRPLIAPVAPSGALYLEYRPLSGPSGGLARRCAFAGGAPVAESLEDADGLCAVLWPGGALELELAPVERRTEVFSLDGVPCALARGDEAVLTVNGQSIELPADAEPPRWIRPAGLPALTGALADGGQYLATLAEDMSAFTGLIAADRLDFVTGDMLSAIVSLEDTVGHGLLEQWLIDRDGPHRVSSESVWRYGAPRWPQTPEDTMIAAVEAARLGLFAEVEGYLTPALAQTRPLAAVGEICQACAPMRYGLPDPRPQIALLRAVNDHLAVARPLYYRAVRASGPQGPYRIEAIEADDP